MIPKYVNDWLTIIEQMNNDNTYKLAWGRAVVECIAFDDYIVVLQYDENMNLIKRYETINDAVKETGTNGKSIRDCCNGVQKHAGGYVWRFEDKKE